MKTIATITFAGCLFMSSYGQIDEEMSNDSKDSLLIDEYENNQLKDKVLHAEPLYIDLIRDLGARKGEKEWNVGGGIFDNTKYDEYESLIEYEWAPVDRLGLEVELPFTFYLPNSDSSDTPSSSLNSLKLAGQYTFLVSEKASTSLAVGYIHEFLMPQFNQYGKQSMLTGFLYNPFFIAAKRWGNNFHTLLYTGPMIEQEFQHDHPDIHLQINSNFHYMISGTRNFIGIEFNKEVWNDGTFRMTMRPQMRLEINDQLLVGIVTGIPVNRKNQRFSSFLRLIYEPGHR
ncbi:MAG: HAEPLYID family protein [Bacteroidota bacterium]